VKRGVAVVVLVTAAGNDPANRLTEPQNGLASNSTSRVRPIYRSAAKLKKKVKEVELYSAFIVLPLTQGAQVRITQCYLQITPYLPLPRKHSPDGASSD